MFNKSKYTKWYFSLIESRRTMSRDCFTEKHHIIPKCMGGTNDPTNLVSLTPREHYICHRLLCEMVDDTDRKRKMKYALMAMNIGLHSKDKTQSRVTSKQYEKIKILVRDEFLGEKNPFWGKGLFGKDNPMYKQENYDRFLKAVRSPEHRKMMRDKFLGDKNPFYGKQHTQETKVKLSKAKAYMIDVAFEDGIVKSFAQYGDLGTYLGKSTYLGAKLCSGNFNHLLRNYGIMEIIKHGKDREKHSES